MALGNNFRILRQAAVQWSADHASEMGAALAYFTLFSIAPLLVIAISIAGLVYGEEAAQGAVETQLKQVIDPSAARAVQNLLIKVHKPAQGIWATSIGFAVLVIGALGAFLHLRNALCRIWRLEPPGGGGLLQTLLNYGLAVLMVLCCGVLLLGLLAATTVVAYLGENSADWFPGGREYWQALEFIVSFTFLTLLFAVLFRILSARRIRLRLIWYGAAVTALLFTVGKLLIGFYLAYTGTESAYGAAGSLVVFLIWIYYSAQIVFFGAELVQARRSQAGETNSR